MGSEVDWELTELLLSKCCEQQHKAHLDQRWPPRSQYWCQYCWIPSITTWMMGQSAVPASLQLIENREAWLIHQMVVLQIRGTSTSRSREVIQHWWDHMWGPVSALGSPGQEILEHIQRRSMKVSEWFKHLTHKERLRKLGLFRLEKARRRLRVILSMCINTCWVGEERRLRQALLSGN